MSTDERAPSAVVFTDLDGTLLDHSSYDASPALPALDEARAAAVPVILCSSKTRAEIAGWQARLRLTGPFISENGGGVFLTGGGPLEARFPDRISGLPAAVFGTSYRTLRRALRTLRGDLGLPLRGFGDMTTAEIARATGLASEDAELARQRDFDEPVLWPAEPREEELEAVRRWLSRRRLRLLYGGRFWHLTGRNDKGAAVRWVLDAYEAVWGRRPRSLALGDSENDLPMLRAAEQGVLVERPGGGHLAGAPADVALVSGIGPAGWGAAVSGWLAARKE